jgi:SAM-dependent methyltransferase
MLGEYVMEEEKSFVNKRRITEKAYALCRFVDRVEMYFRKSFDDYTDETVQEKKRQGEYEFIPLNAHDFTDSIIMLQIFLKQMNRKPKNFVDLGCGPGVKSLLAEIILGCNGYGIDSKEKYVFEARKFWCERGRIIKADLLCYEGYKFFDILYFYHPLCFSEKQFLFEKALISGCKNEAIILAKFANHSSFLDDKIYGYENEDHVKARKEVLKIGLQELGSLGNLFVFTKNMSKEKLEKAKKIIDSIKNDLYTT